MYEFGAKEIDEEISIPNKSGESKKEIDNYAVSGIESEKKVSSKIVSKKARTWKRRKKLKKGRMCINCILRNAGLRRTMGWKGYLTGNIKLDGGSITETSDIETVFGKIQTNYVDCVAQC